MGAHTPECRIVVDHKCRALEARKLWVQQTICGLEPQATTAWATGARPCLLLQHAIMQSGGRWAAVRAAAVRACILTWRVGPVVEAEADARGPCIIGILHQLF